MSKRKQYRVIQDYWDLWGIQSEEDAIVDFKEIKRLSVEWEAHISDLLDQCEVL